MTHEFEELIDRQIEWSAKTFGSGRKTEPLCRHIEKELAEIRKYPEDLLEWVDVAMLAIDGAWRSGYTSDEIAAAFVVKLRVNMERKWNLPSDPNAPIEHVRDEDKLDDDGMSKIGYA